MLKKILLAVMCTLMLFCAAVSAAELKAGGRACVQGTYSLPVTEKPSPRGSKITVNPGDHVIVLEPYINGKDKLEENYHKVMLTNGKTGYIFAYVNGKATLEPVVSDVKSTDKSEKKSQTSAEKKDHGIDMNVLSDYIYGGSKALTGKACDPNKKIPAEWRMYECPAELPIVARGIVHVGDEGKFDNVCVSFYPGTPAIDFNQKRLDDLAAIGFAPTEINGQGKGDKNTAFYCMSTSEFNVVGYNDRWVAVWAYGSLDTSRGMGGNLCATFLTKYGSWKSGVYFIPRQYCYILDVNNQINYIPEAQGKGKATAPLMVKTTPDLKDYVKSGVYKINQSFQVVNAVPQNGHYQIYYKEGLYYVEAKYVNLQLVNAKKPLISYIAEVDIDAGTALILASVGGECVAEAKKGAAIDVIQKDMGNGYSKIWFNTKECYIKTECLTGFQSTPAASGLTKLAAPIGTLAVDTAWSEGGQAVYTPDELEILKSGNYGSTYDIALLKQIMNIKDSARKMWHSEWVNVYGVEDFSFYEDGSEWPKTGKIYTVVHEGVVRYIVQFDNQKQAFTFYPGSGYFKYTTANTQALYVDTVKYDALAYNIDGNNYFKLRDIAKMFDGTVKRFDVAYDGETNTIDMLSLFDYNAVGGELALGDGAQRTAYSSTAFLTFDGAPVKAICYNIEGNNYFKLRDITDALDCRVEWDGQNQLIRISTAVPAYDDPSEPVG